MDYQEFLQTKRVSAKVSGFDVAPDDLNPILYPFQRDITRWSIQLGRAALFENVGLGKTFQQLEYARQVANHTNRPVLILAPLGVAAQTVAQGKLLGTEVKRVFDQGDVGDNPIVITNYDRVHLFDPSVFSGVILDECFAAGTLIDCISQSGEIYQMHIERIQKGDKIINASGIDTVSDIHRRKVDYAIKVTIKGQSIISSPNHPWFTQRGWVGSQDLEPGDHILQTSSAMRMVRQGVYAQISHQQVPTVLQSVLLSELAYAPTGTFSESPFPGSSGKARREKVGMVSGGQRQGESGDRTNTSIEPDERPGGESESIPHIESYEPQTFRAWGQWDGINRTTVENAGGTWRELEGGIHFITGKTDTGLSNALQTRLSERRNASVYRGGWSLPPFAESAGHQENRETEFVRVDGIEVLELGNPELDQFRDADGSLYFYDIGATQHPSFSIDGMLVHNSSILKHYSKTFFALCEMFENTPYRLCCTATPAPNDWVELGNHAMFLGIMHFKDMLARWFVGEGDIARSARLKHHAEDDFWRWLTTWAVCISRPSDLGAQYDMPGYELPELHIHEHELPVTQEMVDRAWSKGQLIPDDRPSATSFMKVKRDRLSAWVDMAVEVYDQTPKDDPIIFWCDTDFEADALKAAIPESVEVRGSHTIKHKEETLMAFSEGKERVIITKPEIAGFGLNWQHCNRMYIAASFSFERTYQAIGRIHRYGQKRDCHVHFAYAETEGNVIQLLAQKQEAFKEMQRHMSEAIQEHGLFRTESNQTVYSKADFQVERGDRWTYYLGDCIQVMPTLKANSIDLTVTSIPFSNLYIYSDSEADVGNAADKAEFFEHMKFVIAELLRITRPGRCCAVHVKDLPLFLNRDGEMGIDPFSDDTAAAFRAGGWTLQSRITIEKDPVIEMQKTNSHGLLFKNYKERAEILRVGLPDYVLVFQKPGDKSEYEQPVRHDPNSKEYHGDNPPRDGEWLSLLTRKESKNNHNLPVWQRYANPNWSDVHVPSVWTDIQQTKVLNYRIAKGDKDERHICPLQLDLIARVVQWKSNEGDVVFDPFGGIGSTGFETRKMNRDFIGVELKPEYHKLGVKYLKEAENLANAPDLFMWAEAQGIDCFGDTKKPHASKSKRKAKAVITEHELAQDDPLF